MLFRSHGGAEPLTVCMIYMIHTLFEHAATVALTGNENWKRNNVKELVKVINTLW